jgi:hypothetical protein
MKKKIPVLLLIFISICSSIQIYAQERAYHNAFKITFLSFLTGSTKVTYERATFSRQSLEITVGVIGWGYDKFKVHPKGGLLRVSYKFILYSKSSEPLNGFYIKPEFAFSHFKHNIFTEEKNDRTLSSWGTLMGCTGYQFTRKWLVLDGFIGVGAGIGTPTPLRYHHGFIDRMKHVTFTFGLKFGIAFGKKHETMKK